jgi:hypothetical protein
MIGMVNRIWKLIVLINWIENIAVQQIGWPLNDVVHTDSCTTGPWKGLG